MHGCLIDLCHSLIEFENKLLIISKIYSKDLDNKVGSINFFIGYQGIWTIEMIESFEEISYQFVLRLKKSVWWPDKTKTQQDTNFPTWAVPTLMYLMY